jgi:glycosyl transferase family 25
MSHNIDKIFYINLEKRKDRREEIEKELDTFGLNYERFEAIETPGFGILGCGISHLSVLKLAKERKYKNILILEDDFTFIVSKEEFEKSLNLFFFF